MVRVLILLGPPGAGKGTQATRLSKAVSVPHVATGDLFRTHLREGTALGVKAKEYMNAGNLVPDGLVTDMLFDRIMQVDCQDGFVLDGFPRTLAQAESLDQRLPSVAGSDLSVDVGNLEVPTEMLVERAAGRLLCRNCDHIQHVSFLPPKVEGVCDACGGELYRRDDDKPEIVRERLAVYDRETRPLIEFYQERDRLTQIDGSGVPDEVFASVMEVFGPARRETK